VEPRPLVFLRPRRGARSAGGGGGGGDSGDSNDGGAGVEPAPLPALTRALLHVQEEDERGVGAAEARPRSGARLVALHRLAGA